MEGYYNKLNGRLENWIYIARTSKNSEIKKQFVLARSDRKGNIIIPGAQVKRDDFNV